MTFVLVGKASFVTYADSTAKPSPFEAGMVAATSGYFPAAYASRPAMVEAMSECLSAAL